MDFRQKQRKQRVREANKSNLLSDYILLRFNWFSWWPNGSYFWFKSAFHPQPDLVISVLLLVPKISTSCEHPPPVGPRLLLFACVSNCYSIHFSLIEFSWFCFCQRISGAASFSQNTYSLAFFLRVASHPHRSIHPSIITHSFLANGFTTIRQKAKLLHHLQLGVCLSSQPTVIFTPSTRQSITCISAIALLSSFSSWLWLPWRFMVGGMSDSLFIRAAACSSSQRA